MENKEGTDRGLRVYLFQMSYEKTNEDGAPTGERGEVEFYGFEGDPYPVVDYGDYGRFGTGILHLYTKNGLEVLDCIDSAINYLTSSCEISVSTVKEMMCLLDRPGKWVERCLDDEDKTRVKILRQESLPEIGFEETAKNSDGLSVMQRNRIKINGIPLFPEGGVIRYSGSNPGSIVFRPNLVNELGKVWEDCIRARSGVDVCVSIGVETFAKRAITITARSREDLVSALGSVGVVRPNDAHVSYVSGDGNVADKFIATVYLCDEINI